MADYNSSLPIRTEGDTHEKVQSKIVDFADPTKGQVVDVDGNAHVEMHGNDPTSSDQVLRLSEQGALTPDGVYDAVGNSKPGNIGLVASERNASPSDNTQTQRLTSVTQGNKRLLDVSIHDENGQVFSSSNPLPVTSVDSEGDEVNAFDTATEVAAGSSADIEYVVSAGKILKLSQIHVSASGKLKVVIKVESAAGSGSFATKFVMFNSSANPNILASIHENVSVSAGAKVRVTITNRDTSPMDLYCTICGHEI